MDVTGCHAPGTIPVMQPTPIPGTTEIRWRDCDEESWTALWHHFLCSVFGHRWPTGHWRLQEFKCGFQPDAVHFMPKAGSETEYEVFAYREGDPGPVRAEPEPEHLVWNCQRCSATKVYWPVPD